jgi:thiol-disulfide isomerase/thioredoxin
LFVFKPPEGAKETDDWTLPGITKPDLVGKPPPLELGEARGKVVLLNFWATWCVPCKRDLPGIEKVYKEFKDQGLVVIGFDVGEEKTALDSFLKTAGITFSIRPLLDTDNLLSALSVTALPTMVLIDREGNIASYEVGARGEAALRADLAKLGLSSK